MAYVIGSQKGKDIAEGMKTGETYKASDGSTWTKRSDGSVSVTHNGQTYDNAYTPTSSGGGSTKNSPYTQGNYTIGSDYGKQQANSMGIGASWVATDGSEWVKEKDGTITVYHNGTKTNNAWQPSDLGTLGLQQMDAGASWKDVLATYNSRYNKAMGTEGLEKYASDEIQNKMWAYIEDAIQKENQQNALDQSNEWLDDYNQNNPKAEYDAKYDPQIEALLSEILNRDDFSYNAANDPLYQQYAKMYQREGERAMKETLAEAAASAGGMNTYAITAAQQANSYYNSQLNDKIPELYQLAYEMYLNDKESKVQDLGILQSMDATQYNRYRDTISDYYADKNFAYGAYQDAIEQGNWQANYDYNSFWDNKLFENENYWKNKEFDNNESWKNKEWERDETRYNQEWEHDLEREAIDDGRYADETSYNRDIYEREVAREEAWKLINLMVMPSPEVLEKAGIDEAIAQRAIDEVRAEKGGNPTVYSGGRSSSSGSSSSSKKSSGGGGGSGSGDVDTGYTGGTTPTPTTDSGAVSKGMTDLGIGLVFSPNVLVELEKAGAITEKDGKLIWNAGWNDSNWQEKLNNVKKNNPFFNLF